MKKCLLLTLLFITTIPLYPVRVSEAVYEGSPHYIIKTRTATYWFDRQGGGISKMIDRYGNDWVAFKKTPWNINPESAASSYRGIPNLVFQGEDAGCGHPGWDKCESSFEAPDIIRTRSKSGKWEWTWTFYEDKAVMEVLKSDPSRSYWFLYEGPAGGKFDPRNSFWMNSDNGSLILSDKPDHIKGHRISGNWSWAAFGHKNVNIMLLLTHITFDNKTDSFSYMGNSSEGLLSDDGMLVFGFGRTADTKPLLMGNHKFEIGFITQKKLKIKYEQKQ
jgi:hypothetical protein